MKPIVILILICCFNATVRAETSLRDIECFHSKVLEVARVKLFHFSYRGILSRPSEQAGLIRERSGEWQISRGKGYENAIYMRICEKNSDLTIKINNKKIGFQLYNAVNERLKNHKLFAKITGYSLVDFSKTIEKISPMHREVNPRPTNQNKSTNASP